MCFPPATSLQYNFQMVVVLLNFLQSDTVKAILLILLGFVLGAAEHVLSGRRERRKAISRALTDLLEVRYQFVGIEALCRELEALGPMPGHVKSRLRLAIDSFLPDWKEMHTRYDESVTTLSALDPILAFHLRSKDLVRPYIQRLDAMISQDAQVTSAIGPFLSQTLTSKVEPSLRAAISKMALRRGPLTGLKTWWALRQTGAVSEDLKERIESLKRIIEVQAKGTTAAAAAAAASGGQSSLV